MDKKNSAVCELTGYPLEKITKDKLYEVSKELYRLKGVLEKHPGKCTNELFDLDVKVIIYDLTNTFPIAIGIEGSMRRSMLVPPWAGDAAKRSAVQN